MKKLILFVILSMLLLTGCTKYYNSSDEVFDLEFSGDFKDLDFCSIGFVGQDSYGKGHFSFLGMDSDECRNIKEDCEHYDNCGWRIHLSAGSRGNSNKWTPTWSGTCYCYDNEVSQ